MKRNMTGLWNVLYPPCSEGKSCMGDREVSSCQLFDNLFLLCQGILHRFLAPPSPFINLRMRFLLRGRAITLCVMKSLITLISALIMHQDLGFIKFKLK
jgi:hypothetical protein